MDTLLRSRNNRRIAGICGALAEQHGWNVTLIRALWVTLVLFAGTGVLAYLILWVVLPEEPIALPRTGYAPIYPSTQPYYPSATPPVPPAGPGTTTQR